MKPRLEGQAFSPAVMFCARNEAHPDAGEKDRLETFDQHQTANASEQRDIGKDDHRIEMALPLHRIEEYDAQDRAGDAAQRENNGKFEIDCVAAPIGQGARHGRGRDLARHAGHGNGWRNAKKDQQRRHQKSAADAEKPGNEPDRDAQSQDGENIHRQGGYRQIDLHLSISPLAAWGERHASRGALSYAIKRKPRKSFSLYD